MGIIVELEYRYAKKLRAIAQVQFNPREYLWNYFLFILWNSLDEHFFL